MKKNKLDNNKVKENKSIRYRDREKIDENSYITTDIQIEKIDKNDVEMGRTDFVPSLFSWTNISEQKVKVCDMENITKKKDKK